MKTLKVGIVGCGGIANGKHLPALAAVKEAELVAFCDIIEERAVKAAKEYGAPEANVYVDYKKMLEVEKLDVVHVLTPNKSHADISIDAMEAGCDVMCEKPMAKTYADAKRMVDTSIKTQKLLTIGYQNRFTRESLYLKKVCESDGLGEVYYGKAHAVRRRGVPTWGVFLNEEEQGGGPLIDIGTHALDITLWLMNNYKPKMVVGTVYRKLADQTETGNGFGDWDPKEFTVEDSAFGFIVMENGATIHLEASWALNTLDIDEAKCTLCGTKAGADMRDGVRINSVAFGAQQVIKPNVVAGGVPLYDVASSTASDVECRQWIDACLNRTAPMVLPEQAIVVTQILEAIYESGKTGKPVYFD